MSAEASTQRSRYLTASILSGVGWGLIALAVGHGWLRGIWGGVLASPAIGLLVGIAGRRAVGLSPGLRLAVALPVLYLAAGVLGLCAGLWDALAMPLEGRNQLAVVFESVLGTWWGLTFTGYVVLLWPLAWWNLGLLGRWSGPERATSRPLGT